MVLAVVAMLVSLALVDLVAVLLLVTMLAHGRDVRMVGHGMTHTSLVESGVLGTASVIVLGSMLHLLIS